MQELIINAPSGVIDNRAAGMKDCLKVITMVDNRV
jgi:hypothetical protein